MIPLGTNKRESTRGSEYELSNTQRWVWSTVSSHQLIEKKNKLRRSSPSWSWCPVLWKSSHWPVLKDILVHRFSIEFSLELLTMCFRHPWAQRESSQEAYWWSAQGRPGPLSPCTRASDFQDSDIMGVVREGMASPVLIILLIRS